MYEESTDLDSTRHIRILGDSLERMSWFLALVGMLSELNGGFSSPSYNLSLGLFGVYCSISQFGKTVFGLIILSILGVIFDIIFCSTSETYNYSSFRFSFAMVIISLFAKIGVIIYGSQFFAALGGAVTLENGGLSGSLYHSMVGSSGIVRGGYYPPAVNEKLNDSQGSVNV